MVTLRRALPQDAPAIAAVHVASWHSTYTGLLPPAFLAARSFHVRLAFWSDCLTAADPAVHIYVACQPAGAICGFVSGGPERAEDFGADSELYSLYLLESVQGLGLGRRLVQEVLRQLPGPTTAVWVLGINPARRFYERIGARPLRERQVELGQQWFTEAAYDLGPCRSV